MHSKGWLCQTLQKIPSVDRWKSHPSSAGWDEERDSRIWLVTSVHRIDKLFNYVNSNVKMAYGDTQMTKVYCGIYILSGWKWTWCSVSFAVTFLWWICTSLISISSNYIVTSFFDPHNNGDINWYHHFKCQVKGTMGIAQYVVWAGSGVTHTFLESVINLVHF